MPVSHSSFVSWSGPVSCGCALLPLKTRVKGPAAPLPADQPDIIDESLTSFRANVLYRNFAPSSPADLTLCYLTVLIGETLRACARCRTRDEARKQLTQLSMSQQFAIPGERSFPLPGFFPAPASKAEGEAWRAYFRQAREETVNRVIDLAYSPPPVVAAPAAAASTAPPAAAAPAASGSDAPQNKCQAQTAARCTAASATSCCLTD